MNDDQAAGRDTQSRFGRRALQELGLRGARHVLRREAGPQGRGLSDLVSEPRRRKRGLGLFSRRRSVLVSFEVAGAWCGWGCPHGTCRDPGAGRTCAESRAARRGPAPERGPSRCSQTETGVTWAEGEKGAGS